MGLQETLLFIVLSSVFIWTFYKLYKMDSDIEHKEE
jgi:hypothetical protein